MNRHEEESIEHSPAIYGWVHHPKSKQVPLGTKEKIAIRKGLPSLTGLLLNARQPPSLERLGYFQTNSAVRRGIVVAAKIKQGFKLRLVAVRKHLRWVNRQNENNSEGLGRAELPSNRGKIGWHRAKIKIIAGEL